MDMYPCVVVVFGQYPWKTKRFYRTDSFVAISLISRIGTIRAEMITTQPSKNTMIEGLPSFAMTLFEIWIPMMDPTSTIAPVTN